MNYEARTWNLLRPVQRGSLLQAFLRSTGGKIRHRYFALILGETDVDAETGFTRVFSMASFPGTLGLLAESPLECASGLVSDACHIVLSMPVPVDVSISVTSNREGQSVKPKGYSEIDLSPVEQAIFEKLPWWRVETARKHNVSAYVIFHDATMREIAKGKPESLDDLRNISGVGEKKLETYGDEIVSLIVEMG